MGVVSSVGNGVAAFWDGLCRGTSGIRPLTRFDTEGFKFTRGGEVSPDALPAAFAPADSGEDMANRLLLTAASEAIADAGLGRGKAATECIGTVVATNFGGAVSGEALLEQAAGKGRCSPQQSSEFNFSRAADHVAETWGLGGPRVVLSLSCASGTAAVGYGADLVRNGRADAVLACGYDALSRFAWSGLSALRTMTKDEIRPFDKGRAGTIFSEGAGVLVLESLASAQRRGAAILAEFLGHGTGNNAHHMTAPAKRGAGSARAMAEALRDAGIAPDEVDHVNTHGTGTKYNDLTETEAIKDVFGEHARAMPITSIKSMTGHMMGAAGSVEAIAAILSLRNGIVPPTINYRDPDPECDLDVVTNSRRDIPLRTVLTNSAGIGGCNAAAVFRRFER